MNMKRTFLLIPFLLMVALAGKAEETANNATKVDNPVANTSDSVAEPVKEVPMWKKKLYYGYNFDVYYHHDSNGVKRENGWSFSLIPELGWRVKERVYVGMRFGGGYQDAFTTTSYDGDDGKTYTEEVRVRSGFWEVTPYARYRLRTFFNDKFAVWIEAHLFTGMEFPSVYSGNVAGTEFDGLKYTVNYGAQVSPVITYYFDKKRTFQLFFSIISLGYSGTARCYNSEEEGKHFEYTNDVMIFSGKLRGLVTNQFAPGLYGIKFGVIRSF